MSEFKIQEVLKEGMVFKNYRDLCRFISAKITDGNSRRIQLEKWSKYFSHVKDGNKYIITKVYL